MVFLYAFFGIVAVVCPILLGVICLSRTHDRRDDERHQVILKAISAHGVPPRSRQRK